MTTAAFTGSFDPITHGHTDLIERAGLLFDTVLVGIGVHPAKQTLFTPDERIALAEQALAHLDNIEVMTFESLTVAFCQEEGVDAIIRGLRNVKDFEYELQMDYMNTHLEGDVQTLYMAPAQDYQHVSSTLIRELASYGADISQWVHPDIANALRAKFS